MTHACDEWKNPVTMMIGISPVNPDAPRICGDEWNQIVKRAWNDQLFKACIITGCITLLLLISLFIIMIYMQWYKRDENNYHLLTPMTYPRLQSIAMFLFILSKICLFVLVILWSILVYKYQTHQSKNAVRYAFNLKIWANGVLIIVNVGTSYLLASHIWKLNKSILYYKD